MSNNTPQTPNKNQKPARLGRGLGSLLGGASLDDEPATPVKPVAPAGAAAIAPTAPAPSPQAAVAAPVQPTIPDEAKVWMIQVDRLTPNTQQPRQVFTPEALKELTASIKEKGILMPIVARRLSERQFEIIAGERRWRAAQAAGLHEVPVLLRKATEQDSLELAIIENIQRENLNAMEEAEAFDHLMGEYNLTQQQVAEKLGKDRSSVANTLRLLTLPAEVKALVRNNELSPGHAKVILGAESAAKQIELAKQVVTEKLSVRATEKLVAKAKTEARARATGAAPQALNLDVSQRLIEGLSAELQKLIGTKVAIDYADSKGKLSIHFYSDDQLTQVVEKIRAAWEK